MREVLEKRFGQTDFYVARVEPIGRKQLMARSRESYWQPAVMLLDVVKADTGEPVTDHLRLPVWKPLQGLKLGDIIKFRGTVGLYQKAAGVDYTFRAVSDVTVLSQCTIHPFT